MKWKSIKWKLALPEEDLNRNQPTECFFNNLPFMLVKLAKGSRIQG